MQSLITTPTITEALEQLGVKPGATLMVHCAMSSFGQVIGGTQTIIEALMQTVGQSGTLVMPTLTNGRFDPSEWGNPPAPEAHWHRIRFETPSYHPQKTPTDHTMSQVYELFRTWPGVVRTTHPHSSVAAWGQFRDEITAVHLLDERFGESSPLARLYDIDAEVLFLGTTYNTNTCFHLAEYRQANPPTREFMIVLDGEQGKSLERYRDVNTNSSIFEDIGTDFENHCAVEHIAIGQADCRLFRLRDAVDFARDWLNDRSAQDR